MKKAIVVEKKEKAPSPIKVSVKGICDLCKGRGLLDSNTLCASCGGSGRI